MKYLIIGTAGHVDHGKTALVKALTGKDTDQLKEEKERGISIDLGFAALTVSADCQAGIVDVPGHERYLKNMLAGTGGIDLALLVVAADEGVMPQTTEHLAMLDLLGVSYGLIVLNKIDKVDDTWLDMVEEEVRQAVAGTFLARAPVCRVSAVTGAGMAELRQVLARLAREVPGRDSSGPVKLWIDRAFAVKGFGVVVTGSLLSGRITPGDALVLWPAGRTVRVRSVQVHGVKTAAVLAGQRAALNLNGIELSQVHRGMLLTAPGYGQAGRLWDATGRWLQDVPSGTPIRLHVGTAEYLGKVYYYKNVKAPYVRLALTETLVAGTGERGIIRRQSPQDLVGGVVLLGPAAMPRRELSAARQGLAAALVRGDDQDLVYHVLLEAPGPLTVAEIVRQTGFLGSRRVTAALAGLVQDKSVCLLAGGEDGLYIAHERLAAATECMLTAVKEYHATHPGGGGLAQENLRRLTALAGRSFEAVLDYWQRCGLLCVQGPTVLLPQQAARQQQLLQALKEQVAAVLSPDCLENITAAVLAQRLHIDTEVAQQLHAQLVRDGVLLKVGEFFVYSKTMQYIAGLMQRHFAVNSTLTVAQFRDLLGITRKLAIPLLEYCDMHKYTIRQGDVRIKGDL